MSRTNRRLGLVVAALFGVLALVRAPSGASAEPPAEWQYQFAPYIWVPSISVTVGSTEVPVLPDFEGETSTFDLLDDLDGAFLGLGEARYGPYGALVDLMYLGVTIEDDTPFNLFSGAEAEVDALISTAAFTYRVGTRNGVTVDVMAGARFYSVDVDLTFHPGMAMRRTADRSAFWVDPIAGGRVHADLGGDIFAALYGDVGGFGAGSKFTSQVYLGVGYNFSESTSAQIGYRYLGFEYEDDGAPLDMDLYGPLIGGNFRF